MLSILHLSDFHFKNENNSIFHKMDKFINCIKSTVSAKETLVIIITGDIAFSGKKQEYDTASSFINYLKESLNYTKNLYFFMVPGNHDCDFDLETSITKIVRDNLSISKKFDIEYFNELNKLQVEYSNFMNELPSSLFSTNQIIFEDFVLYINCINSSWMSKLNETTNSILIPQNTLEYKFDTSKPIVSISCIHHPLNWIIDSRNIGRIIDSNSDIVLLGHEHQNEGYIKENNDFCTIYSYAKEMQNTKEDNTSGFTLMNIKSIKDKFVEVYEFSWDSKKYIEKHNRLRLEYKVNNKKSTLFLTEKTNEFINSFDLPIYHSKKENIELIDLFVMPNFKKIEYDEDKSIYDFNTVIENKRIYIHGINGSGKTTLCKFILKEYSSSQEVCVYFSGEEFKTPNSDIMNKLLSSRIIEQYENFTFQEFINVDFEKKICIIDNFDKNNLSINQKNKILEYFEEKFSKIIVLTNKSFIEKVVEHPKNYELYCKYEICDFIESKREELINKWVNLDSDLEMHDLLFECKENSDLITKLIRNGLMNSTPMNLVLMLSNKEILKDEKNNQIYQHIYKKMLYHNFLNRNLNQIEIDTIVMCLSVIAYSSFVKDSFYINEDNFHKSIKVFLEDYHADITESKIVSEIEKSNVILKKDSSYIFSYQCYYYYLVAYYISRKLTDQNIIILINNLIDNVGLESNFQTLVFLSYFTTTNEILNKICTKIEDTLHEVEEHDFNKRISFTQVDESNSLIDQLTLLDENEQKVVRNSSFDEDKYDSKDVEANSENIVTTSFKLIELAGNILKNNPVEILGDDKILIINSTYKLMKRVIGLFTEFTNANADQILKSFNTVIEKVSSKKFDNNGLINIFLSSANFYLLSKLASYIACPYITTYKIMKNNTNDEGIILLYLILEFIEFGKKHEQLFGSLSSRYFEEKRFDLYYILFFIIITYSINYGLNNSELSKYSKMLKLDVSRIS